MFCDGLLLRGRDTYGDLVNNCHSDLNSLNLLLEVVGKQRTNRTRDL